MWTLPSCSRAGAGDAGPLASRGLKFRSKVDRASGRSWPSARVSSRPLWLVRPVLVASAYVGDVDEVAVQVDADLG